MESAMTNFDRIDLRSNAGRPLQALAGVEKILGDAGLSPLLRHLVKLRASQINGCAFCVAMHIREARQDGETAERLDSLVVWRDVDDYGEQERAALAWTEALTRLDAPANLGPLHSALARHFSGPEIAALTVSVAMINLWNRLMVASHGGQQQLAA
jgi:AhpD family alkylhydroperoxidase